MPTAKLDERKQRILAAIIEDYLNTAIPVGSRALTRAHPLHLSAATIRNEMSDLEQEGFLEQPHTSAGRTPTVKGYRFYVDHLMKKPKLRSRDEQIIADNIKHVGRDLEELLHGTLKIITTLTDYAAIAMAPQVYHSAVKVVQMVLLNIQQSMVVLMTNTGLAKDVVLDIPPGTEISQEDLNRISNLLTDQLQGKTLDKLNQALIRKIVQEIPAYKELIEDTLQAVRGHLEQASQPRILTAGISHVLRQPEFQDNEHIQLLLQALEQETSLAEILQSFGEDDEVVIRIGSENTIKEMRDCSIVIRSYNVEGASAGHMAVVGPTRMLYDRSSAILNRVAEVMTSTIQEA